MRLPNRHLIRIMSKTNPISSKLLTLGCLAFYGASAGAQTVAGAVTKTPINLSTDLDSLVTLGLLPFIPAVILMMSAFTRIIIVLSLTRQALGLQTTPPNQVLIGIALALTAVAMGPTMIQVQDRALQPWREGKITLIEAVEKASVPLSEFMERNTRASAREIFTQAASDQKVSPTLAHKTAAFSLSEIRSGLEIGILILVPFLLIDLIVASVLMSLGMMMLSPAMVSLPIKILIFVLADGWTLVAGSLVGSFL